MVRLELAIQISLPSLGSIQTFPLPHLRTLAASRFWSFRDTISLLSLLCVFDWFRKKSFIYLFVSFGFFFITEHQFLCIYQSPHFQYNNFSNSLLLFLFISFSLLVSSLDSSFLYSIFLCFLHFRVFVI